MEIIKVQEIVEALTKECQANYDKHKTDAYTIKEFEAVPIVSRTISSRKVNDWGTDEDRDEYIWYSREGWKYTDMTVQVGAGIKNIVKEYTFDISQEKAVQIISEWAPSEQEAFAYCAELILRDSIYKVTIL